MHIFLKLNQTDEVFLNLAFIKCSKHIFIQLANDDQKNEENKPQKFYQFNKKDKICVKLADKKSVYFKLWYTGKEPIKKKKPHVQIEDDDPVFFKLAKKETIILKQANTRNEVSFELNESHRFYFKADET